VKPLIGSILTPFQLIKVKFELRDPNLVFQGNFFIMFRSNPNFLDGLGMGFCHGTSTVVLDAWGGQL